MFERAKPVHAFDRAATVIGYAEVRYIEYKQAYLNVTTEHATEESMLCSTAIPTPGPLWLYPRDREIPCGSYAKNM
jgi:hypothetical protein